MFNINWIKDVVIPVVISLIASLIASFVFYWYILRKEPPIWISNVIIKDTTTSPSRYLIKIQNQQGDDAINIKITATLFGNVKYPDQKWKYFYPARPIGDPTPAIPIKLSRDMFQRLSSKGERGEPSPQWIDLKINDPALKIILTERLQLNNIPESLMEELSDTTKPITLECLFTIFDYIKVEVVASHAKTGFPKYFSKNINVIKPAEMRLEFWK